MINNVTNLIDKVAMLIHFNTIFILIWPIRLHLQWPITTSKSTCYPWHIQFRERKYFRELSIFKFITFKYNFAISVNYIIILIY